MSVCWRGVLAAVAFLAPSMAHAQGGETRQIETPFLWSLSEAEVKCPAVAAEVRGKWTGQWRILTPGKTSLCEVSDIGRIGPPPGREQRRDIEAGPIWNQADAESKCPSVASNARGRWTGQWRTTVQGAMSVCEVAFSAPARDVEAGPIWSQADAEVKCPVVGYAVHGRWTGQWRTTVQGRMSVCEIED